MEVISQRGHIVISIGNEYFMFKPSAFFGEGFETVPYNEILAYEISRELGLSVVPETGLKTLPLTIASKLIFPFNGSCQRYVDNVLPLHLYDEELDKESVSQIVLLDAIIGNTDRKAENVVVDLDTGKVWGVDNGFSLGFHHPNEVEKRGGGYEWDVSLFDIEHGYLNIDKRLTDNIDWEYIMDYARLVQRIVFSSNIEAYFQDDPEMVSYLISALEHRIRYLPTLLGKQMGGR